MIREWLLKHNLITKILFKGLLGIILVVVFIISHEITHEVIFEQYGCEDIRIDYFKYGAIATTSADCGNISNHDSMVQLQLLNEIVGYNIMPFLLFLVWILYNILAVLAVGLRD
jgi:hypothetical protein